MLEEGIICGHSSWSANGTEHESLHLLLESLVALGQAAHAGPDSTWRGGEGGLK